MSHQWLRSLVVLMLVAAPVIPGYGAIAVALGGDCGGGIPCKCGDTVVTSTTLSGRDPVTKTPCPCHGLIVESNVKLTLAGTIRGLNNVCTEPGVFLPTGILLKQDPPVGGVTDVTNVTITGGKIVGFEIGVGTDARVTKSVFSNLQILDSVSWGMRLEGDDNVVESVYVTRADSRAGIEILGDRNAVRLCGVQYGGAFGFVIDGDQNTVFRNVAHQMESFDGFTIAGHGNLVDQNRSEYNGNDGFGIFGSGHALGLNWALDNGGDGFDVDCSGCTFDRNRSSYNGGWGILDLTGPNTFTDNRCIGNGLGASNPGGRC